MKLCKIDNEGYFVEDVIVDEYPMITVDGEQVKDPLYIDETPKGFYKPKWDFETQEWVEGLSQVEMDKVNQRKEDALRDKIREYRWEKQNFYTYDTHLQRFEPYDVQRMTDIAELLKNASIPEVTWAFADESTEVITDYTYLVNLKNAGYQNEQVVRGIENAVLQDTTVTEDNYKEKFDALLGQ